MMRTRSRLRRDRRLGLALSGLLATAAGCGDDASQDGSTTGGPTDPSDASADDGDTSDTDTVDDTGDPTDGGIDIDPPPAGLRRLLEPHYVASVELLLGPEAAAVADPPDDPSIGTFDAMATLISVPAAADVEIYENASRRIAETALANKSVLAQSAPCVNAGPFDASCYEQVARQLGRLAWRRPLTDAQVDRLVGVALEGQAWGEGDHDAGLKYLIMAILQSPRFLYVVEIGQPQADGSPRVLDGYEIATRLSFFITGRTPDASTLALAEAGDLDDDAGVRALAETLVQSPAAHGTVGRFFGEYLRIRELSSKGKSAELFPLFSPALADAMFDETMLLVHDIVFQKNESMLGLFDADYTYVNDVLAPLYGVDAPAGSVFGKVTLPPGQKRAGILSHPSWLSMMSHTDVNSPTRRGLFVYEQMLCTDIPPPPPDVNPQPIVVGPGQTLRDALSEHMTNEGCSSCHALTDPIGFAFENYDAIGAFRQLENGNLVDASGDVPGLGTFEGAAELVAILRDDARLPGCLVRNVYTQGLGYVPGAEVEPAMQAVTEAFGTADHRMKQLMVELAASPLFRLVGDPQ